MALPERIILDTDPGVDDVLALLLALSAPATQLEVVLISVTFGNVEARRCLRNVVAVFEILEQELAWRRQNGLPEGFEGVTKHGPIPVAVGAEKPLYEELLLADYFHGYDGLAGIHESHPHFSPADPWEKFTELAAAQKDVLPARLPQSKDKDELAGENSSLSSSSSSSFFSPLRTPSHKEILRILRENEPDTITIVAVGPLTNLALAAAEDTEAFLRVKEVVSMGGAVDRHGNVCGWMDLQAGDSRDCPSMINQANQ